jgi:hypothetical protein
VESVPELSLDGLVSDYPEGGVDGLSVEPGEQRMAHQGVDSRRILRGAVCLGDDGGLSSFHQKPWMTR